MTWETFTDDLEAPEPSYSSLLPSSLKDVWGEPQPVRDIPRPRTPQSAHPHFEAPFAVPSPQQQQRSPHIGSAPSTQARFPAYFDGVAVQTPGTTAPPADTYYSVYFHRSRTQTLAGRADFDDGDIVITEADRGLDIGQIVGRTDRPPPRELKNLRVILRKASRFEIDSIAAKEERENQALAICRVKVQELGLPMEVTGAEYQFDGKKLTFYYNATKYIDFRNLVRTLFRTFGTRIWMMWYDGGVPVRDVKTRLNEDIQ
jgi:hypothetical protein